MKKPTREEWAKLIALISNNRPILTYDYSEIRPVGAPLSNRKNELITSLDIIDIMNKISKVIVANG